MYKVLYDIHLSIMQGGKHCMNIDILNSYMNITKEAVYIITI